MLISGTKMFLKTGKCRTEKARGFTLLELLVVLLILGATLALSIGTWGGGTTLLESESKTLLHIIRQAKADAMLSGHDVILVLKGTELFRQEEDSEKRLASFPSEVGIAYEDADGMTGRNGRIVFAGTGVASGCVLRLYAGGEAVTIGIPVVGSVTLRNGEYSLNDFAEEES